MALTVSDRIKGVRNRLTRAEQLVVRVLLEDYPMPGLGSAASLARRSDVSVPTVIRLVSKLGFGSYAEFGEQLKSELAQRMYFPSDRYPDDRHRPATTFLGIAEGAFAESVRRTFADIRAEEFERIVDLLADPARAVVVTGGWSSVLLGKHLAAYLALLRSDVAVIEPENGARARGLLSLGTTTVVVVFDYRAYSPETVAFGRQAKRRGATLILMTDPMLSPLAPDADLVLRSAVTGPPPFDSLACGFMVVETLLGALAERLGAPAHDRLADFEGLLAAPDPWPDFPSDP